MARHLLNRSLLEQALVEVHMRSIAGAIREKARGLAALTTAETRKLLRNGEPEVELCAQLFEYAAEQGPSSTVKREGSGTEEGPCTLFRSA